MYHVTGIGLTAVLLYTLSYFFYRINYFSFQFHKKLWNILLAVTFIATALAGIFMALQITYKWDLPFIKTVLRWHVEFGIGMAFTGIFHLIWHLSYYGRIFESGAGTEHHQAIAALSSEDISSNLFIIGLVSSSVQLLMLREMLNVAGGYELITGVFLGSWLIGSAIGSKLAGSSTLADIRKINIIFSLSPALSIGMMFFLTRMFLSPGETPSFLVSLIFTLIVLLPFSIVSGFSFVKLITFSRTVNGFTPGKSFSIETAGGVLAGVLISILTSGLMNTYQLLLLTILLSSSYVFLTFFDLSAKLKTALRILVIVLASAIIMFKPDTFFRQLLLAGIKVTGSEDTPYGNITYASYKEEKSTYYNQRLLTYKFDVTEREENIHYAMLESNDPEKVILISGSLSSQLPEILKYPVKEIVFLERDPALTIPGDAISDTLPVKLTVLNSDAFRYIRKEGDPADVIIMSVPPPSTLQLNRFYTTEFFISVKKKLREGGVFMCSPGPGNDYFNKESLKLYSSVYNSLTSVFKNVKAVVGNKLYFIASDKDVSVAFCQLTEKKHIQNIYVCSDYLSDDLIAKKTEETVSLMDSSVRQNKSSFPVALYHFESFNFSKYSGEKIPMIILMILIFAAPVFFVRRSHMLMYFSASALAGFEIIILLTLQIIIGNMYQLTGLVIAGLMAGLALGAGRKIKLLNSLSLILNGIFLLIFYIVAGLIYSSVIRINSETVAAFIIVLAAFLPAVITGNIFRKLTFNSGGISATSSVYSADLEGAALGFILISGIAIPLLGIQISLFLLTGLIFTGLLFCAIGNKL